MGEVELMTRRSIDAGWILAATLLAAPMAVHAATGQPGARPAPPPPATSNATGPAPYVVSQSAAIPPQPLRRDQIITILATLQDAESHGFRPGEFLPPELSSLMSSPNPADRARGDTLLRASIIRYARAQHGLRITNWPKNWALRPAPYDAEADFNFAVSQDRLAQWIETLPPPFDRYRLLKAALVKYRAIEAAGGWPTIDPGPELKLGATGPRVAALRKRLLIEEPSLNTDTSADADTFDQSLLDALQFYQRRNGIDTTGTVGKYTLEALNVPVDSRILQIVANMERWRWAPRLWPATRIEVNIAAAEMTLFQENALTLEMRAAPGRPDDQTPMLGSQIELVVFNPPWNVPQGIMEKEYLPKEAAHPGYLAAHGFRFIDTPDGGRRLQQASGAKSRARPGEVRLPQRLRRLPARHADPQSLRLGQPQCQPRLRAAGAAHRSGRQGVRERPGLDPRRDPGHDPGRQDQARIADQRHAGLPALFHRLSGREGADGFPQRRL